MNRIKELREKMGIQQKQLAIDLGVSQPTVSEWESGKKVPSVQSAMKLAEYFQISVSELFVPISQSVKDSYCDVCGFSFVIDEDRFSDEHKQSHALAVEAKKRFGFFLQYYDRERIKGESRAIIHDPNTTLSAKVDALENVLRALFSRSVDCHGVSGHPGFEDYVAMILFNNSLSNDLTSETASILKEKYGVKKGIKKGTQFHSANHVRGLGTVGLMEPMFYTVPLLGDIACGTPILAQENLDGDVQVDTEIHCDFALRCKGDSMAPRLLDGDLVFIRQQPSVDNGQIAAVLIDTEATLKHVYVSDAGIQLTAENPAYAPIVLTGDAARDARILGKAVAYRRNI